MFFMNSFLKQSARRCVLFLLIAFILGCAVTAKQNRHKETITILDLTYLLKYDYTNPDSVKKVWDILHATATLQGIVNRDAPRLYIKYVTAKNRNIDDYWWDMYRRPGQWLAGRDTIVLKDIYEAIDHYKYDLKGAVVYDPKVASTSNVASSIAGIEDLLALRYDTASGSLYTGVLLKRKQLKPQRWLLNEDGSSLFTAKGIIPGTNIPSSNSIKNDPYIWFIEHYMKKGLCNTAYAGYYIDQKWRNNPAAAVINHHTLTNHDFFVSKRGFFFDLSPWNDEPATDDLAQPVGTDYKTLTTMLRIAYDQNEGKAFCHIGGFPAWAFKYTKHANGKHDDVPTEWRFSEIISAYNAFKDADAIGLGAMANASFWTHFPLKDQYPQKWITDKDLIEKNMLTADGRLTSNGKKYFLFYVGDYDASAWVYQTASYIWDDPNRGKVPMMWSISPILERRAPMTLHYFRETATANDYFVSADNGAGYLNPGMLQSPRPISGLPDGTAAWAEHCKKFYHRWDLSITGFIIDGETPRMNDAALDAYATFSPNGIVPQKASYSLHKGMPVFPAGIDVESWNITAAASAMHDNIKNNPGHPFHWFRSILKTPTWHWQVVNELKKKDPHTQILDAPAFFQLYRSYLQYKTAE
jgi:hypothetical protein